MCLRWAAGRKIMYPRVLSIQSHVVSGYVGNKSATFPLQVLGFEVDAINSVQFSNHKGYKHCKGQILNASELGDLYEGLKANQLNTYTHLLTGFIGSKSFLMKVCDVVKDLKEKSKGLVYVCDPVMGDNGRMYVPKELLPVYKECIIPLADIITPNQYEAELLTDVKIHDISSAKEAMHSLHNMGAKTVVISSSELGSDDVLVALGSSVHNGMKCGIKMEIPRLPENFVGTGDLFAALLMAWLHKHPHDLKLACEKTVSTMQLVLKRTLQLQLEHAEKEKSTEECTHMARKELKLIQSKGDIEDPEICVHAELL